MAKNKVHIKLIRPRLVNRPGDWIEGIVQLDSNGEVRKAQALRLRFAGEEFTEWTDKVRRRQYIDQHNLFNTTMTLWGYCESEDEETLMNLPTGSFVFPFRAQLPAADLPASAEYFNGHVRYTLKAYLRTEQREIAARCAINVACKAAEKSEEAEVPIELEEMQSVGCCLWTFTPCFGNVFLRGRCLQPVLTPGRQAWCTATVENLSRTEVVGVKLSLLHRVEFRSERSRMVTYSALVVTEQRVRVPSYQTFSNLSTTPPQSVANEQLTGDASSSDESQSQQTDMHASSAANGANEFPSSSKEQMTFVKLRGDDETPGEESERDADDKTRKKEQLTVWNPQTAVEREYYNATFPFSLLVPSTLPRVFSGQLITSSLEIVLQASLAAECAIAPRLRFTVNAADSDAQSSTNTDAPPYTPTLLPMTSSGQYAAYFSFDGMEYEAEDQQKLGKPVKYPHFYDKQLEVIPMSLDEFDASWRQCLAPDETET